MQIKGEGPIIKVTRINRVEQFYVNENHIEFIEETPDTIISLESGKKIVVMEPAEEIIRLIIEQRLRLLEYRRFGVPDATPYEEVTE